MRQGLVLLKKKAMGAAAMACMLSLSSPSMLYADELEDEQASYEQQAQEKLEQSNKIQIKINELSEELVCSFYKVKNIVCSHASWQFVYNINLLNIFYGKRKLFNRKL